MALRAEPPASIVLLNGKSVGSKNKLKPPYLASTTSRLHRHVPDRTRIKADKERNIAYHEKTKLGEVAARLNRKRLPKGEPKFY